MKTYPLFGLKNLKDEAELERPLLLYFCDGFVHLKASTSELCSSVRTLETSVW